VELFTRGPGQLFGEMSLFLGRQVNEARAVTRVLAIRLDAKAAGAALVRNPVAMHALGVVLAKRAELAEARLSESAIHSVRSRLVLFLERLAKTSGVRDSRGILLPHRLTHNELARLLGVSRESVSRGLAQLRRQGTVSIAGRRLVLRSGRAGG
jgi:CRP/FNR family cyclic AMP-dependent transcriptional regulator